MTGEELARSIVEALRAGGEEAYYVGGCVRDRLMGRPSSDYDVATSAPAETVQRLFPRSEAVGAAFGVVLVKGDGGAKVEVATFRRDHGYGDGRRPESVSFTRSAEEDVRRRDFTMNGLLYDPLTDRVLDYVGGRADIAARLVRAIGDPDERFREDKLRLLRAVRFAARLDFEIEPETFAAIRRNARGIGDIAAERVRDELNRILTEGRARRGFELLESSGLLAEILPEVADLRGVEQPPEYHPEGDVWTHTLRMLEGLEPGCSPTLAMGVLLHDIGKPGAFDRRDGRIRFHGHVELGKEIAERICRRLRYSRADTEQIVELVGQHMRFMHVRDMRESTLKRFLRLPKFDEHLELHRLDCASSHGKLDNYEFVRARRAELSEKQIRPPRLVTGDDLLMLGYRPGPKFRRILAAAEDAQLEGRFATREEALAWTRERFPPC